MASHPVDSGGLRAHGRWLALLTGVFGVRVLAQPLALVVDSAYLPRFESWQSGALPYPVLAASQAGIFTCMAWSAWRISSGVTVPRRALGRWLVAVGAVYAAAMLGRLALGVTILTDVRWFASPVPALFHLGLAAYLVVVGHFHGRYGR